MMFTDNLPIEDIINRIIHLNDGLEKFWSNSCGWAPNNVDAILSKAQLNWQVSLSHSLRIWVQSPTSEDAPAWQILGYANLGAMVEGSLKLFLSVWYNDYKGDVDAIQCEGPIQNPDNLKFEKLRCFFKKRIWCTVASDNWDPWIERIQYRRNAIHAFKKRDIGNHMDLLTDIRNYLKFLRRINHQLPYPDDGYGPMEASGDYMEWVTETDAPTV
ncbi:MAG: hypothetical protein WC975_01825 [Phycisphaerae bacterium]